RYLLVSELGDNVTVAWRDGKLTRFDTRDFQNPQLIETIDLVAEDGESLTSLTYLLGRTTLLAGDSLGRVQAWFSINPQEGDAVGLSGSSTLNMRGTGRNHLVVAHTFPATGAAVSCLASSSRIRMFAAGYSDGTARLFHVTSEAEVLQVPAKSDQPIQSIDIAPKNDALVAFTSEGITRWDFDAAHPEVSVATLFRPVWYEGRSQPEHSWQSSGGNDNFEPKYGFMPLVFGTIKATVYSMMFGAPLALLAAIYSSEFLNPRIKSRVKPIIELMASLPSVVLGFIAGLVIAPMIEDVVPSVIAAFGTIPLCFVLGAYLWQLLPPSIGIRYSNWKFAAMLFVALPAGILMASLIGPGFESTLFSGDFKAWLDGRVGGGTPGWAIMFLPLCGLAVAMFVTSFVRPWLRQRSTHWSRWQAAMVSFATFLIGALATILLATIAGQLLNALHLDPRGVVVGQYQQRNAMIVGFIMGFAIIPIIYTIADDALSSVPATLRSASLGAGATPWQTAMRVIMPTAMSGLFSALMIGLGRAVGETMIVLMAAGNTPLMDWNIFNGFQTLSANIATELPEAAQGSTHYRTLFLAALTLFVMTFFINTIAEIIRQRFRKRAYEL
ncbi:MAG: ABC transporter permease subunit, partial [Planctomycetota bacterium]|nr:ABC transporter permease subunit [Planctomycetota bacterium]